MIINYWDCRYHDYDEVYADGDEYRYYLCSHPDGSGGCLLKNKWGSQKQECSLAELKG